MKPRSKSVETIVSQLRSGYGAQRLPSALRTIEIQDVPSRGARKGQRAFLKDVLPKIKYHNTQLDITTEWKKMPERRRKSGKGSSASTSDYTSEPATPLEHASPLIRLHFDTLPTQELLMEDKSSTQIARELTEMIQKTVGGPILSEEEGKALEAAQDGEGERSLSEEATLDAMLPNSISATESGPPSTSNTSTVPPST